MAAGGGVWKYGHFVSQKRRRVSAPVVRETKRVASGPYNFVLLSDNTVRISSGSSWKENASPRLMQEAREALGVG